MIIFAPPGAAHAPRPNTRAAFPAGDRHWRLRATGATGVAVTLPGIFASQREALAQAAYIAAQHGFQVAQ